MESVDKCEFTLTCVIGLKELLLLLFKEKNNFIDSTYQYKNIKSKLLKVIKDKITSKLIT